LLRQQESGRLSDRATNDLTDAVTVDIDAGTTDDWEADAVAKGWIKLLDVSGNDSPTFEAEGSFTYFRIVGIFAINEDLAESLNGSGHNPYGVWLKSFWTGSPDRMTSRQRHSILADPQMADGLQMLS
jgi:hypothetical protein